MLQRDGDIVDTDGISPLHFNSPEDDSFVSVRHRNHLGIMSAESITLTETATTSLGFSLMATQTYSRSDAYGSSNPRAELESGVFGLWAGNMSKDIGIQKVVFQGNSADSDEPYYRVLLDPANVNILPVWTVTGYHRADGNMDGVMILQGTDSDADVPFFTVLGHPENAINALPIFIVYEQLP